MLGMQIDLGPLLPDNLYEVIAGFVFLGLMWFVFAKFVSPMFEKMYQERASQIEGGIVRAQKAETEAALAKKQYEDQLADARKDAAKVREDAKAEAAALTKKLHDQALKDSARLLEQGRAQVEAERVAAREELRTEIGGLAVALAGRIVAKSLDDKAAAQTTIDEFLADLAGIDAKEAQLK